MGIETVAVTAEHYRLMLNEVKRIEAELNKTQEEIRQLTNNGNLADDYDAQPELDNEKCQQIILGQAKLRLKNCVIVPNPSNNLEVQIGSRIELSLNGVLQVIRLEGTSGGLESRKGVCSLQSQLGRQIIGAKVGDKFMVKGAEVKINSIF